jgi:hypothetical protein
MLSLVVGGTLGFSPRNLFFETKPMVCMMITMDATDFLASSVNIKYSSSITTSVSCWSRHCIASMPATIIFTLEKFLTSFGEKCFRHLVFSLASRAAITCLQEQEGQNTHLAHTIHYIGCAGNDASWQACAVKHPGWGGDHRAALLERTSLLFFETTS